MPTVTLPPQLTTSPVFEILDGIQAAAVSGAVEIDCAQLAFVRPFAALLLASELRALQDDGCAVTFTGLDRLSGAHVALAHQGVFEHLGHSVGIAPAVATTGVLPLMVLRRVDLEQRRDDPRRPLGPTIQREADRMTQLVTQSHAGRITTPVAYCFREILRNVFEHAHADACLVLAQRFLRGGNIEIAIVDRGRGVLASLAERHALASHADALDAAIEPGRSRADTAAVHPDPDGEHARWANSGFGLFVLSELGRRTGAFTLVSGDARLEVGPKAVVRSSAVLGGTAVCLKISKPKGVNFAEFVEAIIAEGDARSQAAGRGQASLATRL